MLKGKRIKGFCEQLMDECILVPLFQNESSCKMSSVGGNHMNGFAYLDSFRHRDKMQLGNGLLDECRKRS